jgi:hypothetical protein
LEEEENNKDGEENTFSDDFVVKDLNDRKPC